MWVHSRFMWGQMCMSLVSSTLFHCHCRTNCIVKSTKKYLKAVASCLYTAKNPTELLQVVNFTGLLQLVNKLQQACQFHQVATSLLRSGLLQLVICRLVTTCHLQTCYKLVETTYNNQLATSLLTIWNKPVDNLQQTCCHKLSKAMRTHLGLL